MSSEYSENSTHNGIALKLITVLVGILPIALFLILDDLTKSMVFVNRYTVLIAIAFVVHIVLTVVAKVKCDGYFTPRLGGLFLCDCSFGYTVVAIAFVAHIVLTVVAKVGQDKNEEETYMI